MPSFFKTLVVPRRTSNSSILKEFLLYSIFFCTAAQCCMLTDNSVQVRLLCNVHRLSLVYIRARKPRQLPASSLQSVLKVKQGSTPCGCRSHTEVQHEFGAVFFWPWLSVETCCALVQRTKKQTNQNKECKIVFDCCCCCPAYKLS